jgi:hypothetical protein
MNERKHTPGKGKNHVWAKGTKTHARQERATELYPFFKP